MITLAVNPDQEHKEYNFHDGVVSIGRSTVDASSLNLEKEQLEEVHVKIIKEGSKYYTYNSANDPFVTLNDIPFGKREIKNGDTLQIGKTIIVFHTDDTVKPEVLEPNTPSLKSTKNLDKVIDEKINISEDYLKELNIISDASPNDSSMNTSSNSQEEEVDDTLQQIQEYLKTIPSENEGSSSEEHDNVATLFEKPGETEDIDIDSLVKEVEKLEVPGESNAPKEEQEGELIEPSFDDDEEPSTDEAVIQTKEVQKEQRNTHTSSANKTEAPPFIESIPQQIPSQFMLPQEDPKPKKAKSTAKTIKWKMWVALFMVALTTASLIFSGVYSRLQETSMKSETEAAREISDIALALAYAQINHIQPQRQNWTDPNFLTNSIRAVLSGHHKPYGSIDNHGRIIDGKYLLRIYNNRDMTRFIVIAQPEASLTQWLAPQRAIVIDSKDMVLHRVNDLRPLNRLLVNVNSLSGESGKALYELIKGEQFIQLSSLSNKHNQNGFAPPKQLELMKIGAENYVYNAPRYSQIGEKIMETAIDLVSRPGSSAEFKKLEEEAKLVGKLPDAVVYTSKGMKAALKAQKALTTLLPNHSFLIGYLQIDEQGNMKGSHLIFDLEAPKRDQSDDSDHNQGVVQQQSKEIGGYQPLVLAVNASEYLHQQSNSPSESNDFNPLVDKESPLYLQVTALAKERQDQLQVVSRLIIDLIHKNNTDYVENFSEEIQKFMEQYQSESNKLNQQVIHKLEKLYQEYDFMPMSEFSEYVKAAGLNHIAQIHLKKVSSKKKTPAPFTEANFNRDLANINRARTFEELHKYVADTSKDLRLENIPDTSKLIAYQNKLRTQVLQTLNELLLSPDRYLPASDLTRENRMRLSQILIYSWVSDLEEQNFYLTEFDNLVDEQPSQ